MNKYISKTWTEEGDGCYTKKEPMYFSHLVRMMPKFKGGSVLEIGPGTGLFANMLINKFDINRYKVLDLEKNIFDSVKQVKNNMGFDLEYVFSQNYKTLFDEKFDLIVSNICIPETPKEYREDLLNNIIPNTKRSMIIGQLTGSWVNNDEYEIWLKELFERNFDRVECNLTTYLNCHVLIGEKCK